VSLFRPEALEYQRRRLYGNVTLHQPASFVALTSLAVAAALLLAVYAATGSISRKETVVGWVTPRAGMAQVYAPKGGTVMAVNVTEGQTVQAGAALASLTLDVSGSEGGLAARERTQSAARMAEFDVQLAENTRSNGLQMDRLRAQAAALRAEARQLAASRAFQVQQLDLARSQLARLDALLAKGFVTATDRDQKAQAVLSQEQALAAVDRETATCMSGAADAEAQAHAMPAAAEATASQLRASKASLAQSMAELDVQTSNLVRAPVAGRVTYVNVRPGETVVPSMPIAAIAPSSGALEAEILVPTRAAGFIAKGQAVRLMIDAYPFQRFGALHGVVLEISHAALNPGQIAAPIDFKEPSYRMVVSLPKASLHAYGMDRPLQPGMTLKADVLTDRRTFLQWVLDPLLAARARAAG
jgi:membrane fusion protein